MPNKRKSAFSNAGGDGYFGVGGYVKKQDVAGKDGQYLRETQKGKLMAGDKVTKEEISAAFDNAIQNTSLTEDDKQLSTEQLMSKLNSIKTGLSKKGKATIKTLINLIK